MSTYKGMYSFMKYNFMNEYIPLYVDMGYIGENWSQDHLQISRLRKIGAGYINFDQTGLKAILPFYPAFC